MALEGRFIWKVISCISAATSKDSTVFQRFPARPFFARFELTTAANASYRKRAVPISSNQDSIEILEPFAKPDIEWPAGARLNSCPSQLHKPQVASKGVLLICYVVICYVILTACGDKSQHLAVSRFPSERVNNYNNFTCGEQHQLFHLEVRRYFSIKF